MLLPPHKGVGSEDEKSHGKRSPAARQHSLPDRREAILKPSTQVERPDNSSHRSDLRKTSRRRPVLSIREAPRLHPTCKLTSEPAMVPWNLAETRRCLGQRERRHIWPMKHTAGALPQAQSTDICSGLSDVRRHFPYTSIL